MMQRWIAATVCAVLALPAVPWTVSDAAAQKANVRVRVPPPHIRLHVPTVIPRPLANRPERLLPQKEKEKQTKRRVIRVPRGLRQVRLPDLPPLPVPNPSRFAQASREPDVVVVSLPAGASNAVADAIARDNNLTVLAQSDVALLGLKIVRLRIPDGRPVDDVVAALGGDARLRAAQSSNLFTLDGGVGSAAPQYAAAKLHLNALHRVAGGRAIRIAIIDSGVDTRHETLRAAHIRTESVLDGGKVTPADHGTQVAGIIAASGKLTGIAPQADLIAIEAFGKAKKGAARSTSYDIVRALDRAYAEHAQVINMSFAGAADPLVIEALDALASKGVVLVAAAGNEGPGAPPAYPGAHPGTIAVTATDAHDAILAVANRGSYIALAAPGVDIIAPGAGGRYLVASGTSFAAAYASGAAALLLQSRPGLTPASVRDLLTETAHDLGKPGPDPEFGAGLIDPLAALAGPERLAGPARRLRP